MTVAPAVGKGMVVAVVMVAVVVVVMARMLAVMVIVVSVVVITTVVIAAMVATTVMPAPVRLVSLTTSTEGCVTATWSPRRSTDVAAS